LKVPTAREASDLNPWKYSELWVLSSLIYDPLVAYGRVARSYRLSPKHGR